MKAYLLKIIGAVLICVFTDMALPEKWSKYTKIITGLIIISAMVSPLDKIYDSDYFKFNEEIRIFNETGENYTINLLKEELENNIKTDIETRIKDEFNSKIDVDVIVGVNEENKISEVIKINLNGAITEQMINRVREIYEPKEVLVNGL